MKRHHFTLLGAVLILFSAYQNCGKGSGDGSSESASTDQGTNTNDPVVQCPPSQVGIPTATALSTATTSALSGMGDKAGRQNSAAVTFKYVASNAPANCQQGVTVQCTRMSSGNTTAMNEAGVRSKVMNGDISCMASPSTITPGTTVSISFRPNDNDSNKKCFEGTETYQISLRSSADTNKMSPSQNITVSFKNNCYPEQITKESLDAYDQLGTAVAVDGSTAAVLAPGDDGSGNSVQTIGAIYIYTRSGANTWTRSQILRTLDTSIVSDRGAAGDTPSAIALKGDVLAIGSEFNNGGAGAVYLFKRTSGMFSQTMKFSGSAANSKFGKAVALDSTKLVVGAPGENASAGSVYVYDHSTRNLISKISSPLGANGYFGAAVAVENSLLAVGAPGATLFRDSMIGELVLYQQSGSAFSEISSPLRTKKTNIAIRDQNGANGTLNLAAGAELGQALSIYQGAVLVGVPGYAKSDSAKPGTALLLSADRSTIQTFTEAGSADGARYGSAVSLGSAGAFISSPELRSRAGLVDHFALSNGTYRFLRRVYSSSGANGDQFGASVATSGNYFVVGARVKADPLIATGAASFFTTIVP